MGGIIGSLSTTAASTGFNIHHNINYNVLSGTTGIGGIVGSATNSYDHALRVEDNTNEGTVSSTGTGSAGIIGSITTSGAISQGLRVNNNVNSGALSGAGTKKGGILGMATLTSTLSIGMDILQNINQATISGSGTGGIAGDISTAGANGDHSILIENNLNSSTISGNTHPSGGILGKIVFTNTGNGSLTLRSNINDGALSGSVSGGGGIVGSADLPNTATAFQFTLTRNESKKTFSCAENCGGIIGLLDSTGANHAQIDVSENSYTLGMAPPSVGSLQSVGGIVGGTHLDGLATNITASFDDNTVNARLYGQDYTGGIIGYLNLGKNVHFTLSNSTVTGEINGNNATGGLLGWATSSDTPGASGRLRIRSATSTASVTANEGVGGLIGWIANHQHYPIHISDLRFENTVNATGRAVGGVAGCIDFGDLSLSTSYAKSSVTGGDWVGGIIGRRGLSESSSTVISQSSAQTGADGHQAIVSMGDVAGGIIGYLVAQYDDLSSSVKIEDSYAYTQSGLVGNGTVAAVGGIVGYFESLNGPPIGPTYVPTLEITRSYAAFPYMASSAPGTPGGLIGTVSSHGLCAGILSFNTSFYLDDMRDSTPQFPNDPCSGTNSQALITPEMMDYNVFLGAGWNMGITGETWYPPNPGLGPDFYFPSHP